MTSPVHDLFEASSIEARRCDIVTPRALFRGHSRSASAPLQAWRNDAFIRFHTQLFITVFDQVRVINSDAHCRILQVCILQAATIIAKKLPSNALWSILACTFMVSKSTPLQQISNDAAIQA